MFIWLYFIFFTGWAIALNIKYKLNISVFIIGLYSVGAMCGLTIYYFFPHMIKYPGRITFEAVSVHILFLWLFMFPLVRFGNALKPENLIINPRKIKKFAWCIIVPSIAAMALSAYDLVTIFAFGDMLALREAFLSGDVSNLYVSKYGPIGYLVSFGPQISFLAMFWGFYYRFFLKEKSIITTLLFVSSLCMPVNNLVIAGREGVIRWILFILFSAIFFKKYIKYSENKKLIKWLGIVFGVILVVFMQISIDRFENSDNGLFASLLRYGGEQFYLFSYNYYFFSDNGMQTVGQLFPIISQETLEIYNQNALVSVDYFLNSFSTFVGTFIKNVGFYNTLFICLGAFFLFTISFWKSRRWEKCSLAKFTGFLFCYEIVLLGFFYYLHSGRFTQFSIITYIFLAFWISRVRLNISNNNSYEEILKENMSEKESAVDKRNNIA